MQNINKEYIAVHKQEFINSNTQVIKRLSEILEHINNELSKDQDRDINKYSELEQLQVLLKSSKGCIEDLEYIITISRSKI